MILELKDTEYESRLRKTGPRTLEECRNVVDLIKVTRLSIVKFDMLFEVSSNSHQRV